MPNGETKKLLVRVPHEELNVPDLIEHLNNDLVYVVFRKVTNGQFRSIYPFTRNPKYIPITDMKTLDSVNRQEEDETFSYSIRENMGYLVRAYSPLDRGWRSFYTQNLLFYEVYDMEGDTL